MSPQFTLHPVLVRARQVVLHLYQETLERVPFFRGQHPQFITSVVTFMKLEFYAPGDIVVRQGDVGSEMYFVAAGNLEVSWQLKPDSLLSLPTCNMNANWRPTPVCTVHVALHTSI